MRRIIGLAAGLAILAGAAQAQVPIDPNSHMGIANILLWRGEKQATGFRSIETIFKSHTIQREKRVHPLPSAARQIATYAKHHLVDGKPLHLIFASLSTKDPVGMLEPFAGVASNVHTLSLIHI